MTKQKQDFSSTKDFWLGYGLQIFAQASAWVAGPVIVALFVGRFLDDKYDKEPWFFLSLTIVAFIISSIGIGTTGVKFMKRIEEAEELERGRKEDGINKLDKEKDKVNERD